MKITWGSRTAPIPCSGCIGGSHHQDDLTEDRWPITWKAWRMYRVKHMRGFAGVAVLAAAAMAVSGCAAKTDGGGKPKAPAGKPCRRRRPDFRPAMVTARI